MTGQAPPGKVKAGPPHEDRPTRIATQDDQGTSISPYAQAAAEYWDAGWRGVLPLPARRKKEPPDGYTGRTGAWPSRADIQAWSEDGHATGNIALRMPDDVIGVDVDCYDGKAGAETVIRLVAECGPLPATWASTSRSDGSGIRFYRVPPGMSWPGVLGPGIEIIQHVHRYAVVSPSIHPEGRPYTWVSPDGVRTTVIPQPDDLTQLPEPWVAGMTSSSAGGTTTSWTDPDVDQLVQHGIPADVNQDEVLRDVVWKLRGQYVARSVARAAWDAIVAKTTLRRPGEPWTERDFERHWSGADKKIPPPPTVLDQNVASGLPPLIRLDEFLATPDEDLVYRVDKLWPAGGRVILAAAWKAGKTTLLGNLIRALVDGQPFLGHYRVQAARRVVLIDDELDQRTLRRWLREQGITNTAQVELAALRGKVSTFDIIDDAIRTSWARHIGPADVLLLDCLRPILDTLGLDESHDAGRFLVAFDALLAEAGIGEGGIAHHMGHAGERSRGDSRLRDWPDVEWRLVRDKSGDDDGETDPGAARYFAAYGRDVDQPEQLLGYDVPSRRLTITGGSRKDAKVEALIDAVVEYVEGNPGCSQNALEEGVPGNASDIRKARDRAHERGRIDAGKAGNRWFHNPISSTRPDSSRRTDEPPSSPRPLVLYEDEDEGLPGGQRTEINSLDEDEQADLDEENAWPAQSRSMNDYLPKDGRPESMG